MTTRARRSGGGRGRQTGWLVALVGAGLTGAVIALGAVGAWDQAEGFLLDQRMVRGQAFAPPPSDRIVHVDIDEDALDAIGRWPWPREDLALAIDALADAGAGVIVLDLLLDDPQAPRWQPTGEGGFERVDGDAILAESMRRAGNVVIGVQLDKPKPTVEEREAARRMGTRIDSSARPWRVDRSTPVLDAAVETRGFVNVQAEQDTGVIRHLPPTVRADGQDWWQLGVVGAARLLGLGLDDLSATPTTLRVGELELDLNRGRALVAWSPRPIDERTDWIIGDEAPLWQTAHRHVSIKELHETQTGLRRIGDVMALLTGERPDGLPTDEQIAAADEGAAFFASIFPSLAEGASLDGLIAEREAIEPPDDATRSELEALRALRAWEAMKAGWIPTLRTTLAENRLLFAGKLVFIGWTGTGALADFYPTAMGVKTPGVAVHAAIANGILTEHWKAERAPWAPAAWWTDLAATIALGLAGVGLAIAFGPGLSWLAAIGVAAAFTLANALWWFDWGDVAVAMAAPLIALGASWAGGTTVRAVQERREKAAVRRQFAARVSGQLVEYLEENPNLINMEGEERELTMLFTDFAGFTAISERLEGPQTVAILNRFLRAITDVLLEHDAYVNKFMGDGAMAFWGAPMASDRHATDACLATVDCFAELDRQNVSPEHGDLPPIGMRAGIATGRVIVGDCGAPPRLNDYTVIGDAVNLAARLESANKQMGTRALVTRRTYDMIAPEARDRILWRPLGQLRVVGQATPNEILEMVCRKDAGWCDDSVRDWVKRTEDAVAAFAAGEIERAMGLWQDLVVAERGSSGALLYVERCAELLESGAEDWVLPLRSK